MKYIYTLPVLIFIYTDIPQSVECAIESFITAS